jgi:Domain of unknown function (DUF4395)
VAADERAASAERRTGRRSELFAFPDPVDERSARLVAGAVAVLTGVAIVTDWTWLIALLAYGFVAGVLTGPTLSPLGQLVTRVVTPRLSGSPRLLPGPKRFAQAMGTAFSLVALALTVTGHDVAARVVLAMLLAAAILESVFAYCLGCKVFTILMRMGIIPESVCTRCNDISLDAREPAGNASLHQSVAGPGS